MGDLQDPIKIGGMEVPIPYIRSIFQAYVSGNIPTIHMAKNMVQ